ncbi:MAG TPA: molybdate ABC transporter substrate-binding protein [Gammaproteobacteria bacterium]
MRVLALVCLFLIHSNLLGAELRIASAANFYPTLTKIAQAFSEKTGDEITIIRGSTGKLYAQIIRGAPYDLFFSADSARADKLVEQGHSLNNRSQIYAIGQLALWSPRAESPQQLNALLHSGKFNKLSIANPKTAPYGQAAKEALQAMGLYEKVKHKLVYGENISQTLQFVESGAAELGFVARSHVNNQVFFAIDTELHQPVTQKMLILKQTKQFALAQRFVEFLNTPQVIEMIKQDGYQL